MTEPQEIGGCSDLADPDGGHRHVRSIEKKLPREPIAVSQRPALHRQSEAAFRQHRGSGRSYRRPPERPARCPCCGLAPSSSSQRPGCASMLSCILRRRDKDQRKVRPPSLCSDTLSSLTSLTVNGLERLCLGQGAVIRRLWIRLPISRSAAFLARRFKAAGGIDPPHRQRFAGTTIVRAARSTCDTRLPERHSCPPPALRAFRD